MKGPKRNRNIVVRTQFNINGSRGADAGKFVADYVSRESATDKSMAYLPPNNRPPEDGDGVAFTLDSTAISRAETLRLADEIQMFHETGTRAIQQMVISFDPIYLVEQKVVPKGISIMNKGDYRNNYDDIRLRHAVRDGLHAMIESERYIDGRMVAAIQYDTMHLHVHAVVYEHFSKVGRKYGREERGLLKESSLNQLTFNLDRNLTNSRMQIAVPTQRLLVPETEKEESKKVIDLTPVSMGHIDDYMRLLDEQKREKELKSKKQTQQQSRNTQQQQALIRDVYKAFDFDINPQNRR